ncbi:uroporphyrinogen-III synthase [Xylophilus sp. ASV27]|uniref:uroporphyrinogen-III synthase n=1 Tax=Xylophilus sp. ASV27 TaxID=2795129 RepID=UPI0018ED86FB|nr:uroporphyrinogen-III synthase [Xylophilus sp. ASV27]
MRVIVTRPAREAADWVQALRAEGFDAHALPLIRIAPPPRPEALQRAWQALARYQALMFVSINAAEAFFAARPAGAAWPRDTRAWAPGPGTAAALRRCGLAAGQIDAPAHDAAQFDSEALWQQVRGSAGPGLRLLLVRGTDAGAQASPLPERGSGREWLAQQVAQAGGSVDHVVSYERAMPTADGFDAALARAAAGDAWLFSSSEAIAHLRALLPQADWSRARAVATHPRIAEAAARAGFAPVIAARPQLVHVIEALRQAAGG